MKKKTASNQKGWIPTHVTFDPELIRRMDAIIESKGGSRSQIIRRLVTVGLPFEEESGKELEAVTQAVLHQIFPGLVSDPGELKRKSHAPAKQTRTRKKPPPVR